MAGKRDGSVSVEEMIQRAREAQGAGSRSAPPASEVAGSIEGVEGAQQPAELPVESDDTEPVTIPSGSDDGLAFDEPASASSSTISTRSPESAFPTPVAESELSVWRRVWRWGRWVVLAVVVINVIGAFRSYNQPVESLEVGDCFMYQGVEVMTEVETVACSEEHDLEVYAKVDITGLDEAYPGEEPLVGWLGGECASRFDTSFGFDYWTSAYWVLTITPNEEAWESGDHFGLCAVYRFDSAGNIASSTGSARNAGI